MQVTVLGSGQDGGLPQIGATGPLDDAYRRGDLAGRSASSLLVRTGSARLLLDAAPDLRSQWADRRRLPDAVVLTHGHMGHYTGLVHFGKEAANTHRMPVLVTPSMAAYLSAHEPWRTLVEHHLDLRVGFEHRAGDTTVRLLGVPHRAEHTDTVAVSVDDDLLYLPDIDSWDEWPGAEEVIASHAVAFLDATFWDRDEVPGGDHARIPHPPVTDTLQRFAGLDTVIVLTHLNHTNPLCDPNSEESGRVAAAGWYVAHDGMRLEIPAPDTASGRSAVQVTVGDVGEDAASGTETSRQVGDHGR